MLRDGGLNNRVIEAELIYNKLFKGEDILKTGYIYPHANFDVKRKIADKIKLNDPKYKA